MLKQVSNKSLSKWGNIICYPSLYGVLGSYMLKYKPHSKWGNIICLPIVALKTLNTPTKLKR